VGWGPDEAALRSKRLCKRHIDVFEEGFGNYRFYAAGGLDEIVAGTAGLFATESVDKNERFGELKSSHQETGAVNGPLAFQIHEGFLSSVIRAAVCFDFDRARPALGGYSFQVVRLYAHNESGSIP
jgi:hypothetical protein